MRRGGSLSMLLGFDGGVKRSRSGEGKEDDVHPGVA